MNPIIIQNNCYEKKEILLHETVFAEILIGIFKGFLEYQFIQTDNVSEGDKYLGEIKNRTIRSLLGCISKFKEERDVLLSENFSGNKEINQKDIEKVERMINILNSIAETMINEFIPEYKSEESIIINCSKNNSLLIYNPVFTKK